MERAGLTMGLNALSGLLAEFEKGNINDPRAERDALDRHAKGLSDRWSKRCPGFPQEYFPFTSFRGEYYRGKRDDHLKRIITRTITAHGEDDATIVNPACVFGRHSRDLASCLPRTTVIATDIDPNWNRLYGWLHLRRSPANFEFVQDNIFAPQLDTTPTAVVFFGACGSVSDGAIDFAISSRSPYLVCRTCCHDNIGGNTDIVRRPTFLNWFFRFKNWGFASMRRKRKYAGFYFSEKHTLTDYPRSEAARHVSTSAQFLEVSRNSTESDVCRAIIDLDRYLLLVENGYCVWYRGELFFAERDGSV